MDEIQLFVYGTLKRGYYNHGIFIPKDSPIVPARIQGQLYLTAYGFPTLTIPQENILAHGSLDIAKDVALSAELNPPKPSWADWPESSAESPLSLVQGELVTLADPLKHIKQIDLLESFSPPSRCMYKRVMAWVKAEELVLAWVYINGEFELDNLLLLPEGSWPE
ncbi:MAG: gamma-glutamylcyclotransferase [Deltaproteobacteria bacterium]|nr:gamma-glutamylcyclotransferase [Deltaproteobacteria bacterium]